MSSWVFESRFTALGVLLASLLSLLLSCEVGLVVSDGDAFGVWWKASHQPSLRCYVWCRGCEIASAPCG